MRLEIRLVPYLGTDVPKIPVTGFRQGLETIDDETGLEIIDDVCRPPPVPRPARSASRSASPTGRTDAPCAQCQRAKAPASPSSPAPRRRPGLSSTRAGGGPNGPGASSPIWAAPRMADTARGASAQGGALQRRFVTAFRFGDGYQAGQYRPQVDRSAGAFRDQAHGPVLAG